MRTQATQIDHSVIDDLVCGNLQGDEYRNVLRALEAEPQRWRDCALAFLREQALSQELKELAGQDVMWSESGSWSKPGSCAKPVPAEQLPEEQVHRQHVDKQPVDKHRGGTEGVGQPADKHYANLQRMHRFTSLAALLLISFTLGWLGAGLGPDLFQASTLDKVVSSGAPGGALTDGDVNDRVTGNPLADNVVPPSQFAGVESPSSNGRLLVDDSELRLVGDSFMQIDRDMPDWLRKYERAGRVKIDSYEALMPMDLEDGTSALVPVQQYRVKPVVYSY